MDHAVDALRDRGDGFQLTLTTAHGHTLEAIGRAIGGQAIVRIRELCDCVANWPKPTCVTRRSPKRPRCCAACRRRALADLGQSEQRRR